MSADEVKQAIEENATGPKRVQGDEGSVEQHDLDSQIRAHKHLTGNESAAKKHRGMRFTITVPPGATS